MNTCQATAISDVEASPRALADWADFFTPGRLALLLLLLLFAAYPEVILGTHSFFNNDFGLFTYPVAHYTRECIWRGELPLWNPLSNCGVPFLAQWNTTVCYPLSWFYVLFPLPWSLNYFCLGHLVLAGLGMYALALRWTGNRFAASAAGLAYGFNGLTLNCLMWTSNLAALAWLPLTILCVERAWREGGRQLILAALVASMQMLSGAPEIILLTWVLLGTLWLGQVGGAILGAPTFARKLSAVRIPAARLALLILLVSGLSAIQLLPFLELVRHTGRIPGWTNGAWAMPAWGWANFIVPLFRCSQSIAGPYFQVDQQWTSSYYCGIGVVGLALVGARWVKNPRLCWLFFVALCSALLALGEHGFVYPLVQRLFPGLGLARYPIKFVAATVFALPLLAAVAMSYVQRAATSSSLDLRKPFLWSAAALLALITAIISATALLPYPDSPSRLTLQNGLSRALFLILILGGFFLQATTQDSSKRRWLGIGILVLFGLDILTHAPSQNPTVANRAYGPLQFEMSASPQLGESRAMISPRMQALLARTGRPDPLIYYAGNRLSLFENCNLLDGIPKVNGFFSVTLGEAEAVQTLIYTPTNFPVGLIDFLGATQISSSEEFWKWLPRGTALPLVTAGQQPVFATLDDTLAALASPQFDPRKRVYLPVEARPNVGVTDAAPAEITSSSFSSHRVTLSVNADQPTLVVIAQTFFPCWRASVDGQAAKLLRANHAFQAVEVPAGTHRVTLSYRDYWLYAGAAISATTLLGCLIFGLPKAVRPLRFVIPRSLFVIAPGTSPAFKQTKPEEL